MENKKTLTQEEALNKLMKLCSSKEMCSYDLRKKLKDWGLSETDHDEILDILEKEKFFSDQRYAEAFINDRLKFQKWGNLKIKYALQAKQISGKIIDDLLEGTVNSTYFEDLENLLDKKLRTLKSTLSLQEKKARLFRFAAGRGFESEVIYKALNKIIND